jgi:hypothetical protein
MRLLRWRGRLRLLLSAVGPGATLTLGLCGIEETNNNGELPIKHGDAIQ